jgi:hypothetical protein
MATFTDFFFGANFALWEEAIADIFQSIEDQREAALNAIYLSTALIAELADRYGILVGAKPDPTWQLEVFREHLQEVIQAYLMMSSSRAGIQQVVAATTQVPPILRPINLLQRWLLGFQYLPNRFFVDLDGFVVAEVDGPYKIVDNNNLLVLKINGVEQSFLLPYGDAVTAKEVIDSINSTIIGALAFPFGKRFALETIETDVGGSIQVKVESTADTLFGLDNTLRKNAPLPNGSGVLPFGWRLSGSYIPTNAEDPVPVGTHSAPISFDGAIFGVAQAALTGTVVSPFVGLMSPVFLTNGSFENGFVEWDRTDGPEFFISTTKSRTGSKSLAVVTRTQAVVDTLGQKIVSAVVNTIKTFPKFVPEGCTVRVNGFNQAKTPGAVYISPASPPSVYEWTVSGGVFGYVDQQFSRVPVVSDPDAPTILLTDPSVDFLVKGVKVGMAIHVVEGSNAFDGVIKGVSTHQLFIDQWRNGPQGGPTAAHIASDAAAGSGVVYTADNLQDPAKNFTTLGVQVGADFRTRDKVRVDETLSHFGQITTERQVVRDIASLATTTNPNDTLVPDMGWGASPTPLSATISTSGNPYSVYIRPHNGTSYSVFHTLNEIPDFADDFARISANFLYEVRFLGFDGRVVHSEHHTFRPTPGDAYQEFTIETTTPQGGEKVQLVITVEPDDQITELVTANFAGKVFLSQGKIVPDSELVLVQANGAILRRGPAPKYDYDIDYEEGSILFHPDGPAATPHLPTAALLADGVPVQVAYRFQPKPGALVSIDDISFRCTEDDLNTELHVAVDGKMQKVIFKDPRARAQGVITYSGTPIDATGVILGGETYEFDLGSHDTGTISYTGDPNDGDTITIGGATYEFDNDCIVAPGNIVVLLDLSPDQTFTNLTNAINATSSQVTASINTGTNVVTITATAIGQQDPAIGFSKVGTNYTLAPPSGGLTGGAYSNVTPPNIAVFVTTEDETWARLVEEININSTSVFAEFDLTAKTVTVFAIEPGLVGNDVVFDTFGAVPATLNPATGFLGGGAATHAGGHVEYTGQPADGDTFTVGTITYEFDSNGSTQTTLVPQAGTVTTTGKNVVGVGTAFTTLFEGREISVSGQQRQIVTITDDFNLIVDTPFSPDLVGSAYSLVVPTTTPIPIGTSADETYATVTTKLTSDGVVTATQDTVNGRVDLTAVVAGTAGNSIPFSGTITNAALIPSGGFLSAGVNGDFADPNAPTCDEVRDFINAHTVGLTASCETDGRLTLTSDETGLKSCLVIGHGSANGTLGFETDKGKTNSEAGAKPAWRINVGHPNQSGAMTLDGDLAVVVTFPVGGSMPMSGALSAILTPPSSSPVFILIFSTTDDADFSFIGIDGTLPTTTGTAADVQVAFPVSTTIGELAVTVVTPPGLGNSITYKINVNGADAPGITLVLSGTSTTATATGSVPVNAGDLVCISATVTGTPTASAATFSLGYS